MLITGFEEAIKNTSVLITVYELHKNCPEALGAAILGAKKAGYKLDDKNTVEMTKLIKTITCWYLQSIVSFTLDLFSYLYRKIKSTISTSESFFVQTVVCNDCVIVV